MKAVYLPGAKAPIDVPHDVIDGVAVINVGAVMNVFYGRFPTDSPTYEADGGYEGSTKRLNKWAARRKVTCWSAPREDFSIMAAVYYAKAHGYRGVIVEDLS